MDARRGIDFVQKAALAAVSAPIPKGRPRQSNTYAIASVKDAGEPPRPVLERLDVHDLHQQQIAGLGALHLERPREVVDPGEVDVADVVGAVVVLDLAAGPVQALDLDRLAVLDGAGKGDWSAVVSTVLKLSSVRRASLSGCHLF